MKYMTFGATEKSQYPVALLVKSLRPLELAPFVQGIEDDVVAYTLPSTKLPKKTEILDYLGRLLPTLCKLRVEYVMITDSNYFKVLTGMKKTDAFVGYVLPCVLQDYEHLFIIYTPSPGAVMYEPQLKSKVEAARQAVITHRGGAYVPPGIDIIKFAAFPQTPQEISEWLDKLIDKPLAIDIETYSLKHYSAGIGTMTLCWSQHEGIAFSVDKDRPPSEARWIRGMLKAFFELRDQITLFHRSWFDAYVLTYQLFMKNTLDVEGMLEGIEHMLRKMEDTQLILYLATNSCSGNELGLKAAAQEFAGNYAVDVKDISVVPLEQLLTYNLVDGLSTWYVYNKHYPKMIADNQLDIYRNLFKPALYDVIQMQLTGLPMDMEEVQRGKAVMYQKEQQALNVIHSSAPVADLNTRIAIKWAEKRNQELKVKRVTPAECPDTFNVNSPLQLQCLLHEVLGLPVLETTASGQPATGMDTIEDLSNHAKTQDQKDLLSALIAYKQVNKILTAFIPAFEAAHQGPDGWHYLYGSFNLGGTLSGRLSSSDPNLQNLPATGSEYSAIVKQMFRAPKGKLFVGLDFNSLEDRISALTTKDPNKLKVYTDGYDGHSYRAFYYFGNLMQGIVDTPESINSIQTKYKSLRQESKAPTFALTYQGTWRTLVKNCGFPEQKAKDIESAYHRMYEVSDKWVQDRLTVAAKVGYVTIAFGLRLRTPLMAQTVMGTRVTPYEAVAEGRTAGNAMGQSYCMLNTRAATAFMKKVRASEHRHRISICAQIHDAMYFLIDNDVDLVAWVNEHLVVEAQWQELPEIQHPEVKLGGELSLFHPSWKTELTIPNGASAAQITQLAKEHMSK